MTMCGGGGKPTQPAGITINPTDGLLTSESGNSDSFSVVLNSEPEADVTIWIYCNDTTEGTVDTSSLTFTSGNWGIPQTVTVSGVDDQVVDGNQVCKIVTDPAVSNDPDYSELDAVDVSFINIDDDVAGITVNPSSGLVTTEAGGTDSFIVVLNTQPFADVTIELSSSDTTKGTVNPISLTFTSSNWSTPQTVIVTGVDDGLGDRGRAYTVLTAPASSTDSDYNGIDPTDVLVFNIDDEIQVAAGNYHNVAIKSDGTLWAWGRNRSGQLGDGTNDDKYTPTQIGTGNNWAAVAAGSFHTVAVKTDGTLWAWGYNRRGQLGDGTNDDKNTPTQIGTDNDWAAVAVGQNHTLVLKTDGTLWGWGKNEFGQLGDGTNDKKNTPTQVGTGNDWDSVAAGNSHTLALKTDGTLWAWGSNEYGRLGDGTAWKEFPINIW
jgi:hypothetical protein